MELELAADADMVAALPRLRALAACRDGRPRTQSVKVVWHDSPDHALLAAGQTLAERKGVWRLERIVPGTATWLPATPAPILTEDPDAATLPAPLAPLAAFEVRQSISLHQFDGQTVTVTAARGILRAVTDERPIGRIWLSGEEQAVRAAALLIAEATAVAVPLASLAAEGIALATGAPAPPRRSGAPTLPADTDSVVAALTHIFGHLVDVILAHARLAVQPDFVGVEAVHQMRVAVRRTRSALSIFRPALAPGVLDAVTDKLRELGAMLGPTRDWDVFADETVPAIQRALPNDTQLERLAGAAARRRKECQKALALYLVSPAFRALGIELAWFASASFWHLPAPADTEAETTPATLEIFATGVLQQRWKKLVSSGKRIEELDIPALHGVRLRAKRARYAAEMFAPLQHAKSAHRFIRRLSALQERLGVLNDGAVATHLMAQLGGPTGRHAYAAGIVTGFMAARAARIRPRIVRAFERFRRQPVYWA